MKISSVFRSWTGWSAIALGVAGASVVMSSQGGGNAAVAATKAGVDPASLLAERSPGARGAGALLQTKLGIAALPQRPFRSRTLPGQRVPPAAGVVPPAAVPDYGSLVPGEELPPATSFAEGGDVGDVPEQSFGSLNGAPPLGGLVSTPGGGGGGGGGNPPGGGTSVVPPVPGVPEPATWLTMVLGFLTVGGLMRRRGGRVLPERRLA